jgi:E3 ubiquitin-protein transferase RMND5
LTPQQISSMREVLARTKEKLHCLTTDHRDLHGSVSRVGKAIDRNFIADFTATSRTDIFQSEKNIQMLNQIIAQHFYRSMDDVADALVQVSGVAFCSTK